MTFSTGLRALLVSLAFVAAPASAVTITYDLTAQGGNSYRYTYTVENNGSTGGAIQLFDILFDPEVYDEDSLSIVTPNPPSNDWDQLILSSGIDLPAAYDALALDGGIPISSFETGFAVSFTWLGSGLPGAQEFQILDFDTFDVLEVGTTTTVPGPAALPLLFTALVSLRRFTRRSGQNRRA
jgi:hypothetical protein